MSRPRPSALLLGLLVAGLGYANWEVMQLDLEAAPATIGALPAEAPAIPGLELPPEARPLSEFQNIVQRPLFSPTRRPPEEAVAEVAAVAPVEQAPAAPQFRLLGVALDERTRQALLHLPEQSHQWIREGEEIGGWVLASVSAEGVVLVSGERTQELQLYPEPGAAAAPAAQ